MPEHSYSKSIEHEEYEMNNSNLSENAAPTNWTEHNTYMFGNPDDTNDNLSRNVMKDIEVDNGNCFENHSFHLNGEHGLTCNTCDIGAGDSKIEVEDTNIFVDNDQEQLIPASQYLSDVQIAAKKAIRKYTKPVLLDSINDSQTSGEEFKLDIKDAVILADNGKVVHFEIDTSNCSDHSTNANENITKKLEDDCKNLISENSIPEDLDATNIDKKVIDSNNNCDTETINTKVDHSEDNTYNHELEDESSNDICENSDITVNSDIDGEIDKTINNDPVQTPEKNIDISDTNITVTIDDTNNSQKKSNISDDKVAIEDTVLRYTINTDALPGKLVCKECNVEFEIFCSTCRMLSRILDNKAPYGIESRAKRTLPRKILTIGNESNPIGVFSSYEIPKGVIFGPLEGLEAGTTRSTWKLKGGRFVINLENAKNLNWMQFIRRAKSSLEQNLVCFQFKGRLYYKTKRQIERGSELLVFFGDAHSRSKNKAVETYLSPKVLKEMYKVYACTYCCIGMTSKEYLRQHKSVCPIATDVDPLFLETVHCYHCRMFLNKEEHLEYHRDYCQDKHERLWQAQMISEKIIERRRNQAAIEISGKRKKTKEIPQNKKKCVQCSSGITHTHSDSS